MATVLDEISDAVRRLGLRESVFRQLPQTDSLRVFSQALAQFVNSGARHWWWEDFNRPASSVTFADGRGFERLTAIVPDPNTLIWFIVEEVLLDHYPVFETTTATAQLVIGECYGFEYYLVSPDFSWLVCENHHARVIAIGNEVERRLLDFNE